MRRKRTIEKKIWFIYQRWLIDKRREDEAARLTHEIMIMALKWALGVDFDADGNELPNALLDSMPADTVERIALHGVRNGDEEEESSKDVTSHRQDGRDEGHQPIS